MFRRRLEMDRRMDPWSTPVRLWPTTRPLAAAAGRSGLARAPRSPGTASRRADGPCAGPPTLEHDRSPWRPDGLTDREIEVLRLLAGGLSNQEIGARRHISANTAANHVRSILMKTGVANRTQAAMYAARHEVVLTPA